MNVVSLQKTLLKALMVLSIAVMGVSMAPRANAYQDDITIPTLASEMPSSNTPIVPGGWDDPIAKQYEVLTFAPYNGVMYAGGEFPTVLSPNGATSYSRSNIFAFNPNTGQVSTTFAPQINGRVWSILAYGGYLYVAGEFNNVNGVSAPYVVKLNPSTGARVTAFVPQINGKVSDIDIAYDSLVITGKFTSVGGKARSGLANINLTTGAVLEQVKPTITTEARTNCTAGGYRMAINATKTRLVMAGCFTRVNNYAREQLVVLNLNSTGTAVSNWSSPDLFQQDAAGNQIGICPGSGNQAVVEDIDFHTNSRYFYAVTGGGNRGTMCDAVFRYDTAKTGGSVRPDWVIRATDGVNGDTLRSVEASSPAVYVAGHHRWLQYGGTVYPYEGISAVNSNGVVNWNPGKGREIGSRELYFTDAAKQAGFPTGLWVGSDSGRCGFAVGVVRDNQGICFFPAS